MNTAGRISVVGHSRAPDGKYKYWKGRDGSWYITKDWTARYSTYSIEEWFLKKHLNQNEDD